MNDTILSTSNLAKSFDGKPALCGLNLAVPRGSICGFLGRNGAGKTTTLKLLLGMLRPDAGEIRLFGETVESEASSVAARRRIAFVSEDKDLYPFMTVTRPSGLRVDSFQPGGGTSRRSTSTSSNCRGRRQFPSCRKECARS